MTTEQNERVEAVLVAIQALDEHYAAMIAAGTVDNVSLRRQILDRMEPSEWIAGKPMAGRGVSLAIESIKR